MNKLNEKNLITKSNQLIQSRYKMTINEQRILLTTISKINPLEDKVGEITFTVKELVKLLNIDSEGYYKELKKITKNLLSQVVELKDEKGNYIQFHWFSECRYLHNQGAIIIEIHKRMYPYFVNLKKHFTTYQLQNVLKFKSKYSIRFYEFMKMYQFKQSFELSLDDIRELFMCENYKTWSHLKEKVIDVAIKEINDKSDILVELEKIKQSRSVAGIRFIIRNKKTTVPKEKKTRKSRRKKLKFTDYEQREYDYDTLEKQLLGWDT